MRRARLNADDGKKAQARKDLERIAAENADYPGVREGIAALTPWTPVPVPHALVAVLMVLSTADRARL